MNKESLCECFDKIKHKFNWMSYLDEEKNERVYVMPHLDNIRINYCPSCGKEVRGIMIPESEF